MENVTILTKGDSLLTKLFPRKDIVSIQDLLDKLDELDSNLEYAEEKLERITNSELYIPNPHYKEYDI